MPPTPQAGFRDAFDLPENILYFDRESLGALPRATAARIERAIGREWGRDLIGSWNSHDWINLPSRVGDKIARGIGAAPGEVVAADSTSVNLFKLLVAALRLRPGRKTILSEAGISRRIPKSPRACATCWGTDTSRAAFRATGLRPRSMKMSPWSS